MREGEEGGEEMKMRRVLKCTLAAEEVQGDEEMKNPSSLQPQPMLAVELALRDASPIIYALLKRGGIKGGERTLFSTQFMKLASS